MLYFLPHNRSKYHFTSLVWRTSIFPLNSTYRHFIIPIKTSRIQENAQELIYEGDHSKILLNLFLFSDFTINHACMHTDTLYKFVLFVDFVLVGSKFWWGNKLSYFVWIYSAWGFPLVFCYFTVSSSFIYLFPTCVLQFANDWYSILWSIWC